MQRSYFFILMFTCGLTFNAFAQNDSVNRVHNSKTVLPDTLTPKKKDAAAASVTKDSTVKKKHDPHKATIRSAIIPGWGQAYNREYWKLPIVYGALAIPASLFAYNNKWYQETKEAYNILVTGGDTSSINPKLKGLSPQTLQYYRNDFRQSRDYSVLFFLLVWGLNVVDATVFAHLKEFDVSDDLSMHVQPDYNINTKTPSISVALNLKDKQPRLLPAAF